MSNTEMCIMPTNGWRSAYTGEGKLYYQNEITKQTQWDIPPELMHLHSAAQQAPNIVHYPHSSGSTAYSVINQNNDDENNTQIKDNNEKQISKLKLALWIITSTLAIYDIYTDLAVVQHWFDFDSTCSSLGCRKLRNYDISAKVAKDYAYTLLVTCIIGFIVAVIMKIYTLYQWCFYDSSLKYKIKCITNDDIEMNDSKCHNRFGWMPLLIEDGMSITILLIFYSTVRGAINEKTFIFVYAISIITSVASIALGVSIRTFKICKQKSTNKCINCCWICGMTSYCSCYLILAIITIFGYFESNFDMAVINIDNGNCDYINVVDGSLLPATNGSGSIVVISLWVDVSGGVNPGIFHGDLMTVPNFVVPFCVGVNYNWTVTCWPYQKKLGIQNIDLQCELKWQAVDCPTYNIYNETDLKNGKCSFMIEYGFCDLNYNIPCSHLFVDGNATMQACFGYCESL